MAWAWEHFQPMFIPLDIESNHWIRTEHTEYVDLVLYLALLLWAVFHFLLKSASTYVNISAVQL